MWRCSRILFRTLTAVRSSAPLRTLTSSPPLNHPIRPPSPPQTLFHLFPFSSVAAWSSSSHSHPLSSSTSAAADEDEDDGGEVEKTRSREEGEMTCGEAKKLMRLVNVESLKRKLGSEKGEVIGYSELLDACVDVGVSRSRDEASAFARSLDDAGVILLFRDKVYLHPDKVVELVRRAVPLALTPEDDPRRKS
ncbi:hypothetical protein QJS10_CPB21g01752 [Acorus calamus]|uniref:Calcium uniporter protein n=1 Tax=Acorus calamus TaxID=4465 RepID=A0AAV9C697_ACOCL|nr:hypothetical protein QJS10_CPB21g01752 [Acorus calamus]